MCQQDRREMLSEVISHLPAAALTVLTLCRWFLWYSRSSTLEPLAGAWARVALPRLKPLLFVCLLYRALLPLKGALGRARIYEGSGYQRGQLFNRTWCFFRAVSPGACLGKTPGPLSSRLLWICSSLPAALGLTLQKLRPGPQRQAS